MLARRIVVVGTSGSGKTTIGRTIEQALAIPHIELDRIFHKPHWTPTPLDEFRASVEKSVAGDAWVVDGNYAMVADIIWKRAELMVWLDFPIHVPLRRLVMRTLRRLITQEELWNGNRESLNQLLQKDNVIIWAITHHREYHRRYRALLRNSSYPQLRIIRFSSPKQVKLWLENIRATTNN